MFNLKYAFRTLFKTPFVTVVAALSLALGIGANTAIYSIFHLILLQPLPVSDAGELVNFSAPGPKQGSNSCNQAGSCEDVFSYPMMRDLQKAERSPFTAIAGHRGFSVSVTYADQSLSGQGMVVTGSYFPMLGVRPALGRLITPGDDQTTGAHPVAVLGYAFWHSRLGGNPAVLNQVLTVNGKPMTIIGVAPEDFEGTTVGARPYVFLPMTMAEELGVTFREGLQSRTNYWVYLFARLKPGVSMEQAATAINTTYNPIINEVDAPLQRGMSDATMKRFREKRITLAEGRRGQSDVHEEAAVPLMILFSVTGIVLLIACANIANLLLARAANRELEMAVRLSLGATRQQLLRQLLTESLVLAFLGGFASLIFARWTLSGINSMMPAEVVESMDFNISWAAIAFAAAMSLLTGVAFGLFPALHSTRPDLVAAMRNNSGRLASGRTASRFRTTLATAQVALSMALLMSAGLFVKSLWNVSKVEIGVETDNLATFSIAPGRNGYDSIRSKLLYERLQQELALLPGVTGVTSSRVPLIAGSNWSNTVSVEGFNKDADTDDDANFNAVGPGYFRTMKIKLLAGREFTPLDDIGRPMVAVVNEAFAKKFGLGRNPVGKRMALGDTTLYDIEIVGLVQNAKYSEVKQETPAVYFTPHRQTGRVGTMNFYLLTSGNPALILRSIPGVIKRIDATLPVEDLKTMRQQLRENLFLDRMISILSACFALLATLLAGIGLYGVLAYSVAQRTREIGVRRALGASSAGVRLMILRHVGVMLLIGGTIGIAAAIALGRLARSILFELTGTDPGVIIASVIVLSLVALGAGYVPALRASQVEPMRALRYE
jgi:predicted permease